MDYVLEMQVVKTGLFVGTNGRERCRKMPEQRKEYV